jgi:hypothetical protein
MEERKIKKNNDRDFLFKYINTLKQFSFYFILLKL